ncbi:MAG: ornithine cyclodeaminase family protein [Proteobacteria bacterium]|nr:ornithine cyclodeaminase family protein [Pseudomonadota bacterium]
MLILDATQVAARLPADRLVPALEAMFRDGCEAPVRHHHTVPVPGAPDATLLLMPAWRSGGYLGIKLVTIFPGNSARGLPSVSAGYLLMDGQSGATLAMIDGGELTAKRTAATSALAARYLARADARSLTVLGTGRIARELARSHCAIRPSIREVRLWGRDHGRAEQAAAFLRDEGLPVVAAGALDAAVAAGDIVSSATLAREPLIRGAWLRAGTHLDLVGGYTPQMREADDEAVRRASVFADTRDGALHEAGDLVAPVTSGLLDPARVVDLHGLCRGEHPGRRYPDEITLFKSVGAAVEDLAAAILVYESR